MTHVAQGRNPPHEHQEETGKPEREMAACALFLRQSYVLVDICSILEFQ